VNDVRCTQQLVLEAAAAAGDVPVLEWMKGLGLGSWDAEAQKDMLSITGMGGQLSAAKVRMVLPLIFSKMHASPHTFTTWSLLSKLQYVYYISHCCAYIQWFRAQGADWPCELWHLDNGG
jgi:hypothetical protein